MSREEENLSGQKGRLGSILASCAWIGLIGFGGGNALVPVIRNVLVEKKKLLSDESYHDKVFLANITPGALPVEISCGIGKETCGPAGMILAPIAMSLPGAVLTILLQLLFSGVEGSVSLAAGILSMLVSFYIIYQLLRYIYGTFREASAGGTLARDVAFFVLVTILTSGRQLLQMFGLEIDFMPKVSATAIVVCVLIYAVITHWGKGRLHLSKGRELAKQEGLWLLVFLLLSVPAFFVCGQTLEFLGRGALSSIVSFGGGDAYLGIAEDLFVQSGLLSAAVFYGQLVTVVNLLPGSILVKTLTGAGYLLGAAATGSVAAGLWMALAGFFCAICFSCLTYLLVEHLYETNRELAVFQFIKSVIKPVVSGIMISVMVSLLTQDLEVLTGIFMPG